MKIRIDKYLADMGAGSRTEIKDDIRKGLVYMTVCMKILQVKKQTH